MCQPTGGTVRYLVGTVATGGSMRTVSAREFNHDVSAAKRATALGPVLITDRGVPTHVLLSIDNYRRLVDQRSITAWLQMADDIEFEPARMDSLPRVADL